MTDLSYMLHCGDTAYLACYDILYGSFDTDRQAKPIAYYPYAMRRAQLPSYDYKEDQLWYYGSMLGACNNE